MLKKRLFIGITSILGVGAVATAVGLGYVFNKKSNEYHLYTAAPLSDSKTDLINCYFSAAVKGAKLIYLASYAHTTPITSALNITKKQNEPKFDYFSKTGYLLIDDNYGFPSFNDNGTIEPTSNQPFWSTNVAAVMFRSELGSFISGIALAEFLNENKDYFLENRKSGELTWATYGAAKYPSVTSFMGGFQQGIEWFNKNVVPEAKTQGYQEVIQKFIGPADASNFATGFGTNDGDTLIDNFLDMNVCALVPVAGSQIQQAIRKIAQKGLRTIVLGVDSAIEEDTTINIKLPDGDNVGNGKIAQFSSIKNIDTAVNQITQKINKGLKDPGEIGSPDEYFGGIGYSSLGTLKNNGVGVSQSGYQYFVKAVMHAKKQPISDSQNWNDLDKTCDLYQTCLNDPIMTKAIENCDKNREYKIPGGREFSYAAIPLSGSYMLPITETESDIEKWYDDMYNTSPEKMEQKNSNINYILQWQKDNSATIQLRKQFSLKDQLTKQQFEKDNNLTKIIFQSPINILFDSSFLESCYLGLYNYWKTEGVILPLPDKLIK